MSIKCPFCGAEYSYGRIICHDCGELKIFFGVLFDDNKREYKWNCNCDMKKIKTLIKTESTK